MNYYQLTPKQLHILKLLSKFRFLNRSQIQTHLNHKDTRRILSWLKDITEKGYTNRIYSETFGENTKPAIYYLTTKSRKILKEQGVEKNLLDNVYREKSRLRPFIDRCISIADVYLRFLHLSPQATIHFFTKSELIKFPYLMSPLPDAYIAIEENKDNTKRYFLEIIDAATPRFVVRNRIEQYFDYASEDTWTANTNHPFPIVLIICPDQPSETYISRHIKRSLEEEIADVQFQVATLEKFKL